MRVVGVPACPTFWYFDRALTALGQDDSVKFYFSLRFKVLRCMLNYSFLHH